MLSYYVSVLEGLWVNCVCVWCRWWCGVHSQVWYHCPSWLFVRKLTLVTAPVCISSVRVNSLPRCMSLSVVHLMTDARGQLYSRMPSPSVVCKVCQLNTLYGRSSLMVTCVTAYYQITATTWWLSGGSQPYITVVSMTSTQTVNEVNWSWDRMLRTHLSHMLLHAVYKHWLVPRSTLKNYARSCVMLPEGRRPEGNITQLRGIIFQCWSRLTVNICFVISQKKTAIDLTPHSALPNTGLRKPIIHTLSTLRETLSNFI